MQNRILAVVDDYGKHRYTITKETEKIIKTKTVTLFDNYPIRFNKIENRLEYFNGEWDVYVPAECIFQVDIIEQ